MKQFHDLIELAITNRLIALTEAQAASVFKVSQSFLSNKRRHGTAEEQIPHVALSPTCVRYNYYALVEWFEKQSASVCDVETPMEPVEDVAESTELLDFDDDLPDWDEYERGRQ